MNAKKGKDLALELMDDLLNEDEASRAANPKNPKSKPKLESKSGGGPPASTTNTDDNVYEFDVDEAGDLAGASLQDTGMGPIAAGADSDIVLDLPEPSVIKPQDLEDNTLKLGESQIIDSSQSEAKAPPPRPTDKTRVADHRSGEAEVRPTVGKYAVRSYQGGVLAGAEAALVQSETLRIAQEKILELEKEVERLRTENEQLGAAGETLRKRTDELLARARDFEAKFEQGREIHKEEKEVLLRSMESKDRQTAELRLKVEELEMRLSTNIRKIRVREQELENRLELVKMESAAIIRSKDELILDLKRQLDQVNLELENYRAKGQDLNKQIGEKQDMLRRTVKALRLALSMLEGGDDSDNPVKKAK